MPNAALRTSDEPKLHSLSEGEVRAALEHHNPNAPAEKVRTLAKIIAAVSDVVAELPEASRRELARSKGKFRNALLHATEQRAQKGRARKRPAADIETSRGAGLGALISLEEGRSHLDRYAIAKPLERWAGPVAGAGEIEESLGIPRSTLSNWQKRGAVVGLLRGERKLAYPLEQFVDARPLEGIADVLRVARDARAAWLWMRQAHGALEGQSPLEALRGGDRDTVVRVAERDFD